MPTSEGAYELGRELVAELWDTVDQRASPGVLGEYGVVESVAVEKRLELEALGLSLGWRRPGEDCGW